MIYMLKGVLKSVNLSISTITAPDSRMMIKSLPPYIQMYTNGF